MSSASTPRSAPDLRRGRRPLARIGDLAAIFRERIDAERGAEIRRRGSLAVLDRNAGRIRHAIDGVERRDDRGRIGESGVADAGADVGSRG